MLKSQHNHIDLEVAALALTERKKEGGELNKSLVARLKPDLLDQFRHFGIRYCDVLSLPKGTYTVRFVVRDNLGGKIGTVTAPLELK